MEIEARLIVKTIMVGNYTKRDGGASFFLYALGTDGNVYRWDDRVDGWVVMPMYIREFMRAANNSEEASI